MLVREHVGREGQSTLRSSATGSGFVRLLDDSHLVQKCATIPRLPLHAAVHFIHDGNGHHGTGNTM